MINITARDIIATILIIGILTLIAFGFDSYLYPILTLIVGYYFSKRYSEEKSKKNIIIKKR